MQHTQSRRPVRIMNDIAWMPRIMKKRVMKEESLKVRDTRETSGKKVES
jgi:hypothetical protein